jgi:2-keto-3-deoxy-6-phosphogluconate aldolase
MALRLCARGHTHSHTISLSLSLSLTHTLTHKSGVELDNPHEFLMNGAASVGLVGPLFDAKDVAEGKWDSITAKV